ncbi:unnamed protein product [Miscanthus lutarioriparius]|uniref:SREBP regulating gene protein n=1 Tax=Miscanthus lutarioriparius TaxID=422564 RepID=A0A811RLZ8_9POAL|nr:unnamed protein product [Miscanthus lutarioriparius]
MASPRPPLGRILRLAAAVAVAACACFPTPVSGIRGCKVDLQCCNSYEYCVSCCLNPSKIKKEDVLKLKVAKPVTAGTYTNVFDFCMGRCRHSSASVVHENAYASDFHHCFSVQQNSSGSIESSSVSKLLGINVVVGRPGESCSLVCKVRGQSCVPSRLSVLNKCEMSYWIGYLVYSSDYAVYHLLQTDIHCAVLAPISENSQPFNQQSVMGLWLGIYEAAQGIWRAES